MRAQRIHRGSQTLGAMLAVVVSLLVSGCSGNSKSDAVASLPNVEVGMTQSQVLAIMGQPQRRENHGGTEFLIYPSDNGSRVAVLNFIPIAIVDGRVTGVGRHAYDHVVRSKAQADLDPQREPSNSPPPGSPRR